MSHPVTQHLREAAVQIQLANRYTVEDHRGVVELYDTLGALTRVVARLPQMIKHLRSIVNGADADLYEHDDEACDSVEALNIADGCLSAALERTGQACDALSHAWSAVGHLRVHDTGIDPV